MLDFEKYIKDGFKIYRPQVSLASTTEEVHLFKDDYPDYSLYHLGKAALDLVKRRETKQFVQHSAKNLNYEEVIKKTLFRGRKSTKKEIRLPPKRLEFSCPDERGRRFINLLLDDSMDELSAERNAYLEELQRITDYKMPDIYIPPAIEVGISYGGTSTAALGAIANKVPDYIKFTPVRIFPFKKELYQKGGAENRAA